MVIKLKDDRILIGIIIEEGVKQRKSGLLEPESADQRKNKKTIRAKVLEIGPDVKKVEINDMIMFDTYAGIPLDYEKDGVDYQGLVIRDEDVVGIMFD